MPSQSHCGHEAIAVTKPLRSQSHCRHKAKVTPRRTAPISKARAKAIGARVRRHPHQGFDLGMEDEPEPHRLLGNRTSPPWYRGRTVVAPPTLRCRQVPAIMYSRRMYDKQMSNKQTL
jgi:hypothetical protein